MIYQLRGTCASGKTTAVRSIVDTHESESIDVGPDHPFALVKVVKEDGKKTTVSKTVAREKYKQDGEPKAKTHIGFRLPDDMVVLGKYGTATSGGVEGVPQDWIRDLVETCAGNYRHVLFEGYHASVPTLIWVPMLERIRDSSAIGLPFVIGFMNTSFETCMARVVTRTPDRQERKPVNEPVQLEHYNQLHGKAYPFFVSRPDLVRAEYVDHENATAQILASFRSDGWSG